MSLVTENIIYVYRVCVADADTILLLRTLYSFYFYLIYIIIILASCLIYAKPLRQPFC